MRKLKLFAMLATAAALVTGCSAATAPATAAARVSAISATLSDMKIAVDRNTISAGPVTFAVKNNGLEAHELVVLQTNVAQDKIAAGTETGKVDETGNVGETGDVDAGGSKTFTVTLSAGRYVLICNEVGHYAKGMHLAFTVN